MTAEQGREQGKEFCVVKQPGWECAHPYAQGRPRAFGVRLLDTKRQEIAMAQNEGGSSSFGWFLAGLGIGALVGVLYAPKSGQETRDELVAGALEAREKANQLYAQGKDQATQYVQQGKETVNQYVQQGKEVVGQAVQQGKEQAGQYVDKGKEYYDKGRTQWTQYVEKGKDLVNTQTEAVQAAVDAGKTAYVSKAGDGTTQTS